MADEESNLENGVNVDDNAEEPQNGSTEGGGRVKRQSSSGLLSFRNIALISVAVVGAASVYEVWRNPELIGRSKVAATPNLDVTPAGSQLATSERYEDNLRRQNQQGALDAQASGTSFVATPDEPLRDIDGPKPSSVANQNRPLPPANPRLEPVQHKTIIVERARQQNTANRATDQTQPKGPDYTRINKLAQLMASQQQGLIQSWQVQPSGITVVVEQELLGPQSDTSALQGSGNTLLSTVSPDLYARAGDVVLASTIITNDSDTPGPVVAEIRRGPLSGSRLVGSFESNTNNTHLIVQFNSVVLPDGTQLPISAYAVDSRQKSLAVRTDLDRRLFQRYAPRVAASFVSGLGDVLSDTGTSLVDIGSIAGITRPQATFEQGVYKGLADVGSDLAQEFVKSAPKGPLISLRSRQIIGVLFTANVEQP